jgi:hypothetical protein
MRSKGQTPKN